VADWNILLGAQSPFLSSCKAVLALVRAVLRATQAFHEKGFVHGDLLLQNIIINHMPTSTKDTYRLNLPKTHLIDLEFSLPPVDAIQLENKDVTHKRQWFKDTDGCYIWLHPICHSLNLLPGPAAADRKNFLDGRIYPDADARLARVDWGADFYTIAYWIELLLRQTNFVDEEDSPGVVEYLEALVPRLLSFDRLVEPSRGETVPRPVPHARIIAEIDGLIGAHDNFDMLDYRMGATASAAEAEKIAAATTQISQSVIADTAVRVQKPQPPSKPPRSWGTVALVAAGVAVAGVAGVSQWNPFKKETPTLRVQSAEVVGQALRESSKDSTDAEALIKALASYAEGSRRHATLRADRSSYAIGQAMRFDVVSPADGYLSVLIVDAGAKWPIVPISNAEVRAGQVVTFPESAAPTLEARPPIGAMRIIAVVTVDTYDWATRPAAGKAIVQMDQVLATSAIQVVNVVPILSGGSK
jgi:hypothetical protein